MANPFFSGRIPQDLYDQIEQRKAQTGESKTDILINALAAYLNYPLVPRSTPTSEVSKEMFAALEERVAMVEKFIEASVNIVIKPDNQRNDFEEERQKQPVIKFDNKFGFNDNKTIEPDLGIADDNKNENIAGLFHSN